jgi:plasmid maintenance system antidote protein VapI
MPPKVKRPTHRGEVVADAVLRVSVVVDAKALGVTRQHLHNVISGKARATAENGLTAGKGARLNRGDVACNANQL